LIISITIKLKFNKKEMTTQENNLAVQIIKEDYGSLAKTIVELLLAKKCYPLMKTIEDLKVNQKLVSSFTISFF
jgi:hypothetical protein